VDSSVAAALLHKAIGDTPCIFVNNGLLRALRRKSCRKFRPPFQIKLQYENATKLFLTRLKGVTDPERKRKIIGKTFVEVFHDAMKRVGHAKFSRRHLYPDVIESVPIAGNPRDDQEPSQRRRAAEEHEIQTVEPLKCLFKDEVRLLDSNWVCRKKCLSPAVPRSGPCGADSW